MFRDVSLHGWCQNVSYTAGGSNKGRQLYEPAYFRGNVIACRTSVIEKYNSLTSNNVGYLLIDEKNAIDIDSHEDFNYAKQYFKNNFFKLRN